MTNLKTLDVIEVLWSGPYTYNQVLELDAPADRGIVQIYGTHPVTGGDTLLYLDATTELSFSEAMARIDHWLQHLPSPPALYVGRLGGTEAIDTQAWFSRIDVARRLLEFFHSPPWNSQAVNRHNVTESYVVLNLGHRHRLALEVSTLWDQSRWDPATDEWRPFEATVEKQHDV